MKSLQEQYEIFDIEFTEEEASQIFKKEYVDKHIDKFKEV